MKVCLLCETSMSYLRSVQQKLSVQVVDLRFSLRYLTDLF